MKVLVCQPVHEHGIEQLTREVQRNYPVDAVLFPEGYISNEALIRDACDLAKTFHVLLITGYRDANGKDRALVIDEHGEVILDRAKSRMQGHLLSPSLVDCQNTRFGYLLCVELLQGVQGFKELGIKNIDFVAHPIGVGMFSEEQFDEWISEAKRVAVAYDTMVLGASHADGSFQNCGVSIPIAYCIDSNGEPIFISKNDVRPVIVDMIRRRAVLIDRDTSSTP